MQKNHSPQPEIIKQMFSQVASKYDQANQVLSFGVHHLWRKKLVALSSAKSGSKILDCATGTGDLAIEFKKVVGHTGEVIGTDFCEGMLATAPLKAKQKKLQINFEVADVMNLPYADQTFDVVSISFGIRNVQDPQKAVQEMFRVTKPGGKVLILEFGQVDMPVFGPLYNFYSRQILPFIGGIVTGQREAYRYLQTSSFAFPCRENFLKLMNQAAAFSQIKYTSLSGGIAYIYQGTK